MGRPPGPPQRLPRCGRPGVTPAGAGPPVPPPWLLQAPHPVLRLLAHPPSAKDPGKPAGVRDTRGLKENLDTAALRMPYCEIFLLQVTAEPQQRRQPRGWGGGREGGGGWGEGEGYPLSVSRWVPGTGEREPPAKPKAQPGPSLVDVPPPGSGRGPHRLTMSLRESRPRCVRSAWRAGSPSGSPGDRQPLRPG